ncbi:MAG: hypothetical protein ABI818_07660 [Acidobacteriota bacterium]
MRLLLVEDERSAARMIAKGLREHGHAAWCHSYQTTSGVVDSHSTLGRKKCGSPVS